MVIRPSIHSEHQGATSYGMAALEERTHVFILRIWREAREIEGATSEWRATIEHVASGERRHARRLGEIEPILARYLGQDTGMADRHGSVRRWLAKWKRS
jgi:hypothetical protein